MPYKDKEKQNRYQNNRLKTRRMNWLNENGPCAKCGSSENLEVDHIDPSMKETHNIWSWSEERRNVELAKCQVLCAKCHGIKTGKENAQRLTKIIEHGTLLGYMTRACRCSDCKLWYKKYRKNLRAMHKLKLMELSVYSV